MSFVDVLRMWGNVSVNSLAVSFHSVLIFSVYSKAVLGGVSDVHLERHT